MSKTITLFRHSVDMLPVAIILLFSLGDFAAYFIIENTMLLVIYWLIMLIPKGVICAWNHHHQHRNVFRRSYQNRILEFFYALHTGVTTNLWVLHHNLGHHLNFLDQKKDQSAWKTKSGRRMGKIEYTLTVAITAYYRGFLVGKKYPVHQKRFLIYGVITMLILLVITLYHPLNSLFIFILPMIASLLFTAWVTYDHHVGLETSDQFAASHNITNKWYNLITGNLGYHTAHHYMQGYHWSQLPALHERIKNKIPENCYTKSTFDLT